jgi:hypothetical protein
MGNMSYCRFENTASALADCLDALEYGVHTKDLSSYEKRGLEDLLSYCDEIHYMKEEIEEALEDTK